MEWLSWKTNVYPDCQTFEIREEGEAGWFGTIKSEHDIQFYPGQYICMRVEAEGGNYGWYIMAYYGLELKEGQPRTELSSWTSCHMLNLGTPEYMLVPSGEWRCHQVQKILRYGEWKDGPYTLFKIHWCGFGSGGTVARPIVVVSDTDLGEGEDYGR